MIDPAGWVKACSVGTCTVSWATASTGTATPAYGSACCFSIGQLYDVDGSFLCVDGNAQKACLGQPCGVLELEIKTSRAS